MILLKQLPYTYREVFSEFLKILPESSPNSFANGSYVGTLAKHQLHYLYSSVG